MLETVKKLGWAPDIVHCNDWMTSLIPLYLKTTYKNDPLFLNTKSVFTIYNNAFAHQFNDDLLDKVKMMDISDNMLENLKTADFGGFIKTGAQYADAVIRAEEDCSESLNQLLEEIEKKSTVSTIEKGDNFLDSYFNLYNELVG